MATIIPDGTTITATSPVLYTATVTYSDNGRYYLFLRQDGGQQEFQLFAPPTDDDARHCSAQMFRQNFRLPKSGLLN